MKPLALDVRVWGPAVLAALAFAPFARPTPLPPPAARPHTIALPAPRAVAPLGKPFVGELVVDKSMLHLGGEAVTPSGGTLQFDDAAGTGELRVALAFGDERDAELRCRATSFAPGPLPGIWVSTWRGGLHTDDEPFRPHDLGAGWLCRLPGQPLRLLFVARASAQARPWLHAELVIRRAR